MKKFLVRGLLVASVLGIAGLTSVEGIPTQHSTILTAGIPTQHSPSIYSIETTEVPSTPLGIPTQH